MPCGYFAAGDDGADARDPLDQALGAEQVERLAHGVAGDAELGGQRRPPAGSAPVGDQPVQHLAAQHVGHLAGPVGASLASAPAVRPRGVQRAVMRKLVVSH